MYPVYPENEELVSGIQNVIQCLFSHNSIYFKVFLKRIFAKLFNLDSFNQMKSHHPKLKSMRYDLKPTCKYFLILKDLLPKRRPLELQPHTVHLIKGEKRNFCAPNVFQVCVISAYFNQSFGILVA